MEAQVFLDFISLQNDRVPSYVRKMTQQDMESSFNEATRGDEAGHLQGSLSRSELLEALMRMAYKSKLRHTKLHQQLQTFLNAYIRPTFRKSEIISVRALIRRSKILNALLWENKVGLMRIYEAFEDAADEFTLESADELLNKMPQADGEIKPIISKDSMLKWYFVYSKMTVLDDQKSGARYKYLSYVEFLEMLCRVALKVADNHDAPVYVKVERLL